MENKLSIIIPVFNEEGRIGKLLSYLLTNASEENVTEIIVVDGGSTDKSKEIVSRFEKVTLLNAPKGRARQMNFGAQYAKGDILYFLHADTFPPSNFDEQIILEVKRHNAGCFRLKFDQPNHFLLKIAPWFTQLHSRLFRGGDQSLFIAKKDFESLNGYDERYTIYEDVEFINRIYKRFSFEIINDYVVTSERKFNKNGTWNLYIHFLVIHTMYWLGASPESLYEYYLKNIRE